MCIPRRINSQRCTLTTRINIIRDAPRRATLSYIPQLRLRSIIICNARFIITINRNSRITTNLTKRLIHCFNRPAAPRVISILQMPRRFIMRGRQRNILLITIVIANMNCISTIKRQTTVSTNLTTTIRHHISPAISISQ